MSMINNLLGHLLEEKSITTWEAYERWHLTTLAQRIHDLREKGYPILSEKIRHDNGNYYSRYWLDPNYLNTINLQGENIQKAEPSQPLSKKPKPMGQAGNADLLFVLQAVTILIIVQIVFSMLGRN